MEYHEYGSQDSKTLKRRSNLKACIGKPLTLQSGKIPASSKAAAVAAATAAAILYQRIQERTPSFNRKRSFERSEFGLQLPRCQKKKEDTPLTLISKNVWFHTMTNKRIGGRWRNGRGVMVVGPCGTGGSAGRFVCLAFVSRSRI